MYTLYDLARDKVRKSLEDTEFNLSESQLNSDIENRARMQREANAREIEIARNLVKTPSISNLVKAGYHYYKGNPMLGGYDETGKRTLKGTPPTVSFYNPAVAKNAIGIINKFKAPFSKTDAGIFLHDLFGNGSNN